jgi:probable HAF family extracellular repeat protein
MPLCRKAFLALSLLSILGLNIPLTAQDGSSTGKCGFQNLTIPSPAGTTTSPTALNDNGAIVGLLNSGTGANFHTTGFLFSGGTFTHFRFPGSADTFANDINKNGVIVGSFRGANGQGAFMVHNGVFHQVTLPGFPNGSPVANGVNDLGDIVGVFTRNGSNVGFLLHQGKLTVISFPGAAGGTFPSSINNQGVIVGTFFTGEQRDGRHGFMWKNGAFTNVEFPGAVATFPAKISNNGDIVGTYIDSVLGEHGFSFDQGRYSRIDRAEPGFQDTQIAAVNSFDNVVGFTSSSSGTKLFKGFCSSVF